MDPAAIAAHLHLAPHPEGGAFAETWRHEDQVPLHGGRSAGTAIHFMLKAGEVSAWHRVASDELWFFHAGAPLRLLQVTPDGTLHETRLGIDLAAGERPQALVPAGHWQAAVPTGAYSLVSCVVVPGFDFADFEMVTIDAMRDRFPHLEVTLA